MNTLFDDVATALMTVTYALATVSMLVVVFAGAA